MGQVMKVTNKQADYMIVRGVLEREIG